MKFLESMGVVLLVGAAAVVVLVGANAYAGERGDCPHAGIQCPMIWDPVICNDGVVYSNKCVARQHCAKGCVPYDGGPIPADGKKKPGGDECPRKGWMCPDVYDPVICDDGHVYSNACVAWVWCATGCVPYGDGGPVPLGDKAGGCDRPKVCPKLWAPVICDDGKVYPNECWAQKKCATGCVPYGEWLFPEGDKAGGCDKPKFCPLLWAPVICDDGKVYANECWAQKKCATGCVPYDEGFAIGGDKKKPGGGGDDECPRVGWMCPDVYDPVICDDGQVYSNSCVAWVWCATGCEPLGPGPIIE